MIQVAGNVSSSFHDHMGSGEWVFFFFKNKKKKPNNLYFSRVHDKCLREKSSAQFLCCCEYTLLGLSHAIQTADLMNRKPWKHLLTIGKREI